MPVPWQIEFQDLKSRSKHLFQSKELYDCIFKVGDEAQEIRGHKVIVSMASPVLDDLINACTDPRPTITISNIEPDIFKIVLNPAASKTCLGNSPIYTDAVELESIEVAYAVGKAAKYLRLPFLEKECYKYVKAKYTNTGLGPTNVLRAYELAICNEDDDFVKVCEEIIKTKTKDVLADSSFNETDLHVVEKMFTLEPLDIKSEIDLLKALDGYATHLETRQTKGVFNDEGVTVRNALNKIRFLSLKPQEFTEGRIGIKILTDSEACAILANIASPRSGTPMPDGFSTRRDPRKKTNVIESITLVSETKLKLVINNYAALKDDVWSSTLTFHSLPWKILVRPQLMDSKSKKEYLAPYAYCNWEDESTSWSCNAYVQFSLIRHGGDPISRSYTHVLKRLDHNWGYSDFYEREKILDESNNFIKDGAITLEVTIKADPPQGI